MKIKHISIFLLVFLAIILSMGIAYCSDEKDFGVKGCVNPTSGMTITTNTTFCPGTFTLNSSITIAASNVYLLCNNTILNSSNLHAVSGIKINTHLENITIRNCELKQFNNSIDVSEVCKYIKILNNTLRDSIDGVSVKPGVYSSEIGNNSFYYNTLNSIESYGRLTSSNFYLNIHNNNIIMYPVSQAGIYTIYTFYTNFTSNNISYGYYGILSESSSNNFFYNNTIYHAVEYANCVVCGGIALLGTSYSSIQKNSLTNCSTGIYAVNINTSAGFFPSTHNEIKENILKNNNVGMSLTDSQLPSGYNPTFNNTFQNNVNAHAVGQGPFYISDGGVSKGNYWDDVHNLCIYDTNQDGYGDAGLKYPYSLANGGHVGSTVEDDGPKTTKTSSCGDGCCWGGETCGSCYADCSSDCRCGDGLCSPGENHDNCPEDCPGEVWTGRGGPPGTPLSCPYLYTWDGNDFVMDNDIIPAGHSQEYTDYYVLSKNLAEKDGKYSVQVREEKDETSYMDKISLLQVEHSENVKIAPTPEGEILSYRNPSSPVEANDKTGKNVLDSISSIDNGDYYGKKGDYIIADFGSVKDKPVAKLVLRTDYYYCNNNEMQSLHIYIKNKENKWVKVDEVHPHALWDTWIVDLSKYLETTSENLTIKIVWTDEHKLDYVGLETSEQEPVIVTELPLVNAIHSKDGDVVSKILNSDDKYTQLKKGEQIDFEFLSLKSDEVNKVKSFVFVSEGYYTPNNSNPNIFSSIFEKLFK